MFLLFTIKSKSNGQEIYKTWVDKNDGNVWILNKRGFSEISLITIFSSNYKKKSNVLVIKEYSTDNKWSHFDKYKFEVLYITKDTLHLLQNRKSFYSGLFSGGFLIELYSPQPTSSHNSKSKNSPKNEE